MPHPVFIAGSHNTISFLAKGLLGMLGERDEAEYSPTRRGFARRSAICPRVYLGSPHSGVEARALAAGELDWVELRRIADRHGVLPMLWRFACSNPDAVPDSFLATLRADFFGNALRNLALARQLVRTAGALDRASVQMIALKGPALTLDGYGDLAMRQFVDLDILIHSTDLPRAAEILVAEGYNSRGLEPGARGAGFFLSYEDQFTSQLGAGPIDVHWRLAPDYFPFAPDEDSLWSGAAQIEIEGTPIRTLAPADHLLFVVAHATKHGWPVLGNVCDVAAIVRSHPELDWGAIAARARQSNCERMLMLGLTLASDLAGARIVEPLLSNSHSDSRVRALAKSITARMFDKGGGRSGLFHEFVVPLRSIESTRDRARYLVGLVFKPTIVDWEFMALPAHFYWLYYAIRPLRLMFQFAPGVLPTAKAGADR